MICGKYLERIKEYADLVDLDKVILAASAIESAIKKDKKIFVIGNGGSMASAQHFAEDLMLQSTKKVRIIALSEVPAITAIANDYSYEEIFSKQLEKLMDDGDILISITASGTSKNIIRAVEYANKKGITISLTGFTGGIVKKISQYNLYVPTSMKDYEATEDIHLVILHIISCIIKEGFEADAHSG